MSTRSLLHIAREYWAAPTVFRAAHEHPWLLRSADILDEPGTPSEEEEDTAVAPNADRPGRVGLPTPYAVVKGANPDFTDGVTLGRGHANDIVIAHPHVSRFHAYFHPKNGVYYLVDANSKWGTLLGDKQLEPSVPTSLGDEATLHFGPLEVLYFSSPAFIAYLERNLANP